MTGRNPSEALAAYVEPLREAIGCVTRSRLTLGARERLVINRPYTVALNNSDPVPLRGTVSVSFTAVQVVQIATVEEPARGAYEVNMLEYLYAISTPTNEELLAFHWTPEHPDERARTFPHMHVGRALLGGQDAVRPGEFHKVHIPTGGRVSIEAIIRMLIEDFDVVPLHADWRHILARTVSGNPG